MNEIIEYLKNKNLKISDSIDEIVNTFFGTIVTEAINYWHNRNCDFIDNFESHNIFERPDSVIAKMDKEYRQIFMKLNDIEKDKIKNLFIETIEGVLFSLFVRLDQSPKGSWKIIFESEDGKQKGIVNKDTELHEDLYEWLEMNKKINNS